jgi:hypothetical protein
MILLPERSQARNHLMHQTLEIAADIARRQSLDWICNCFDIKCDRQYRTGDESLVFSDEGVQSLAANFKTYSDDLMNWMGLYIRSVLAALIPMKSLMIAANR